ncbi:MAG: hypothetical protein EYC70_12265 [Planctomycetota bacterium]|nr:MAG: hypothetical protein EYC70_12265 [Planctomycetota bacterium]
MHSFLAAATGLASALLCAGSLGAQEILYEYDGLSIHDQLGYAVGGLGDVDADGYADFGVSTVPLSPPLGSGISRVDVYSGVDGASLRVHPPTRPEDNFGQVVQGIGDVDGDGRDDYLIGAPFADGAFPSSGIVTVYSGATGTPLYTVSGEASWDNFGLTAGAAGDVDADGTGDFIVGARSSEALANNAGAAYVYSGLNGARLYARYGAAPDGEFGTGVSGAGDVNADGYGDFVIGAPRENSSFYGAGSARIYSGRDGALLRTLDGHGLGDQFGWAAGSMGDLTGDGRSEFFVAAPGARDTGFQAGRVDIYSGRTFALLFSFYGTTSYDTLGYAAANAGDFNGDGLDDIVVGAWQNNTIAVQCGHVRVHSGADGSLLLSAYGAQAGDRLGFAVDGAGDVDADGLDDIIAGAPLTDRAGSDTGTATVFAGCTDELQIAGLDPGLAGTSNVIRLRCGQPNSVAYVYFSLRPGRVPVSGCPGLFFRLNQPRFLGSANLDAAGAGTVTLMVPPGASGRTVLLQALDPPHCELSALFVHAFP